MSRHFASRMGPRPYLAKRNEELSRVAFNRIKIRRLGYSLGAQVEGLRINHLDDETLEEIRQALFTYRVLFFRDQDVSIAEHKAFAETFGEIEEHPFIPSKEGHPDVIRFEKGADTAGYENQWHSDVSWREVPSLGSVLRAVEVPQIGGDTLFADMVAAYECLPDETKERIEGLYAVHDFSKSFGMGMSADERAKRQEQYPPARHPVVRTSPETGDKCLYVNRIFTSHIEGMAPEESAELLEDLCAEADSPEIQYRFQWQKDSIAFWDNRMVQHYATNDYWPQRRVMERITIIGERPI